MFEEKLSGLTDAIQLLVTSQSGRLEEIGKKIDSVTGTDRLTLIANHYSFELSERVTKREVYQDYLTSIQKGMAQRSPKEIYVHLRMQVRRSLATRLSGSLSQSTSAKSNFEDAARNSAYGELLVLFNDWDAAYPD